MKPSPSGKATLPMAEKRATILQIIPELDTGGAELSTIEIADAVQSLLRDKIENVQVTVRESPDRRQKTNAATAKKTEPKAARPLRRPGACPRVRPR